MPEEWTSPCGRVRLINGDCREVLPTLPDQSVNCCVTSPPYFGLRDYGVENQIGLEPTPDAFVQAMVEVFREVRRVLRDDGTLWLNLGDSYGGAAGNTRGVVAGGGKERGEAMFGGAIGRDKGGKPKDLIGIPWRVAFALQADGWYLRQDIIWHKPNPMPESVTDRCTKAHEYIFLMSKSARYYYDQEAIEEKATHAVDGKTRPVYGAPAGHIPNGRNQTGRTNGGKDVPFDGFRNRRSVWTVTTKPYSEAHFATFPPDLISPCILAGCSEGGTVLDPFAGSGTTLAESKRLGRRSVGVELSPQYCEIAKRRIQAELESTPLLDAMEEQAAIQAEMFDSLDLGGSHVA